MSNFYLSALVNILGTIYRIHIADLNCFIAVVVCGLDLSHYVRACLQDRYRNQSAVFCEDLSHSDLRCKYCFFHISFPLSAGISGVVTP